jgi:hypothetical protein
MEGGVDEGGEGGRKENKIKEKRKGKERKEKEKRKSKKERCCTDISIDKWVYKFLRRLGSSAARRTLNVHLRIVH